MSAKDNGGPAFPCDTKEPNGLIGYPDVTVRRSGMSLRDYFAAQVIGAAAPSFGPFWTIGVAARYAERAYQLADAMLDERAK